MRKPVDRSARLAKLADVLLGKRDEAVAFRAASGVERRWREDQRAFEGLDGRSKSAMLDYATGESWVGKGSKEPARSRVIVNIIRGKCNTAEGRFSEIQLPTDDKNWGIKPTPKPELAKRMGDNTPAHVNGRPLTNQDGSQATVAQVVESEIAMAKEKSKAMETEIDDQLTECDFNGENRKVIRSAVRLGTGVLKGPNVVKRIKKAWVEQRDSEGSAYVLETSEKKVPASTNCDVWNIYPDPNCGEDPKRGAYIWEKDSVLPREIRDLIGIPGYQTDQLMLVLREEPKRTTVHVDKGGQQEIQHNTTSKGAPYEKWEYHGDVDREDIEAMGCECPDASVVFSACVVFINDRPVKIALNTLDTGDMPYDFFQWEKVSDSPWGIGEPRKIIWEQRILTAAWRAMMDNAGDSAGAMVVLGKYIEPEDGVWDLNGKKIWINDDEDGDVRQAFAQFQIKNNQQELQAIIELAMKFADMESGTPMLAQGEKGSSPETLGGMQLLMQAADTTRRRQVKQWDDQITRPHIKRYYHWNMQYNPKPEIKGDFEVDARGTSVLLVKDQAAQALVQVFQLRGDPEVNIRVDWGKVVKQFFESRHLDVLKTDAEVKAAQEQMAKAGQPGDPRVEVAKIKAEADEKIEVSRQQFETAEAEKDRRLAIAIEMIDEEISTAELDVVKRTALEKIKAELAGKAMAITAQERMSLASIGHQKDLAVAGHRMSIHKDTMKPPVEPKGKAPRGQAFAR